MTEAAAAAPSLLRQSTYYFIGNAAGRVVGLLMIPFYTSQLSTAEYGIVNLMEVATTVVTIVFGLQAIGDSLTRIYHDQAGDSARRRAVSTGLIAALGLALLASLLALALARPIAGLLNLPGEVNLLRASFVAMAFSAMAETVLVYMRIRERARFFLAYTMIAMAASVALNIWFIGFRHYGVWGFVSTKLIVAGTGSLVLAVLALRDVGLHFIAPYARALARFGGPLVLSSACFFVIHMSDRLFLAQIGQAEVGIYSLAYNFAFLLSVLVGDSFGNSWNATFYRYAVDDGWQQRFARIAGWLIFVLGSAAVAISLLGRDTLRLVVPAAYWPPALLLPVLVFAYFFREVGDFFRNMLLINSGSAMVGRIALAGAALNLALNWLLITGPLRLGIWGAACATAITWAAYCAACWVLAARRHQASFRLAPMLRMLALCAACLGSRLWAPAGNVWLALVVDIVWLAAFLGAGAMLYLDAGQRGEVWDVAQEASRSFLKKRTKKLLP